MARPAIEHLVVLIMENRSFDHLLGYLEYPSEKGFEGIKGREAQWTSPTGDGSAVQPGPHAVYEMPDEPDHSHLGVMRQILGNGPYRNPYRPDNLGFALDFDAHFPGRGLEALQCFPPDCVPVLSSLAQSFAVCDHWFCSVPGATWPNRNFAQAATSDGEVDNVFPHAYSNPTTFDRLTATNSDWSIYYAGFPPIAMAFANLWTRRLFSKERNWLQRIKPIENFYRAVRHDRLPRYAYIEPDMLGRISNSQHPGIGGERDFRAGELLIWEIYESLRSHPAVFEKTLLLITYDEHGGFFDHLPPPQGDRFLVRPLQPGGQPGPAVTFTQGDYRFQFDLLGPRVPAVLVSPYIEKGTVDHTQYDHASIPATIRSLFHTGDPLTTRDRDANSFDRVLTRQAPRTDDLPVIPRPVVSPEVREAPRDIELGRLLLQMLTHLVWDAIRESPGELADRLLPDESRAGLSGGSRGAEGSGAPALEEQVHAKILAEIAPELSAEGQHTLAAAPTPVARGLDEAGFSGPGSRIIRAVSVLKSLSKELEDHHRVDDLQRFVERTLRRYYQDRNVILHNTDGSVRLQPDEQDLRMAVDRLFDQAIPGSQVWLADHQDHWLVIDWRGRTSLYDGSPSEPRVGQVGGQERASLKNNALARLKAFALKK